MPRRLHAGITSSTLCLSIQDEKEDTESTTKDTAATTSNDDEPAAAPPPAKEFDWNEFLDTPFFEPDKVLEDETSNPLLKRLASFVVADYAFAEALLTGVFFVVPIVVAQEVLRMQLYGDTYEPFSRGVLPGNLF